MGTQDDAHSLQYVFNISFNEQQRCVVQVFMDRTLILKYDCYNEYVIYEKQEIKTTNVSKDMKDTLKYVGDQMRWRLLDLKNKEICRDSSILEVWLKCQIDAIGSCSGLWEFHLDGQRVLVFYPENGEYEVHNSSGEEMKKTWESDKEVNEFLKKISMGDCKRWLQVLDWEKVLGTTAAQATAAASASPTTATTTSKAKANTAWIIPLSCSCLILLAFGF